MGLPVAGKAIATEAGVLLMVHVGDISARDPVAAELTPQLLAGVLTAGDIVTHALSGQVGAEEGVTLWPYPKGVLSEHGFPLVRAGVGGEYVFENLEHDFPVRIIYARESDDVLNPRIEGLDGNGPGWSLRRVDCPTGAR